MKKLISILLVATMLVGAVAAFASCGKKENVKNCSIV